MNFDTSALFRGDRSGAISQEELAELQKALTAGYGTDVAALTGGAALRIQSLEMTMLATIQENEHFRLFNALAKSNATATVDEWTEQRNVGGQLGGSTNSELGIIPQFQGTYQRRVGMVKYLMTQRQVSFVVSLQNSISDAEAVEYQNGALQLLTDAEFLSFTGDASVVPTEFDGIETQVVGFGTPDNVIDLRGTPLDNIKPMSRGSSVIAAYGNYGTATDIFVSQNTQSDLDTYLDPAFRVPLTDVPGGGVSIGAPVRGIRTSWGDVKNHPDVFIRDEEMLMPFSVLQQNAFAAQAAANNYVPVSITPTAATGTANSRFDTGMDGLYYYAVEGLTAAGSSNALVSAQVTVAIGGSVSLSIVPSAAGVETGYALYRGRRNGTNALTDLRLFKRIPRNANPANPTVYVDLNLDIPGTTKAYMLNNKPGAKAINWRQFLPMMKFPLYPTNQAVIPWAQLLFGFLRLGKARQHIVYKNILPTQAAWRPFNV